MINESLPPFRKDLKVFPGPIERDGSPTYSLFDPVKGQYYKISWAQAMVMHIFKPGMTIAKLIEEVNSRSSLKVTDEDITHVFSQAQSLNLLTSPRTSDYVQKISDKTKMNWFYWLIMSYLYIRIPLVNPDRFLSRTIVYIKPFISKTALTIYAFLSLIGFLIVLMNFEAYRHTFSYFFNLEGIIYYAVAITFVKACHEMGHAYTAKYFKVHVPTMGIALLVLWPVLYTNVTDAWKLKKRGKRLAISLAGVIVELVIAGLATIGWALTEPGQMHSVFFLLSSSTWLTSLFINLNPAMRFDGYWVFTDLVGIDNLQTRAFQFSRWRLREFFLGLKAPPPAENFSPTMEKVLIVYSIYTWIYRIVLYTAIAWFVYVQFTKILGIFLFALEVAVFIIGPFFSEFKQLFKLRSYFNLNPRAIITTLFASIFLIWFIVPLPHKELFNAITESYSVQDIYIPESAAVEKVYVKRGDIVKKGEPLIQLFSENLVQLTANVKADIQLLEDEIKIYQLSDENINYLNAKAAELTYKNEELKTLNEKETLLLVKSHASGEIYDWDKSLRKGTYLSQGEVVGKIGDLRNIKVICFIPEADIEAIHLNEEAYFKLSNPVRWFKGRVISINNVTSTYLRYPALASTYKGNLPVVPVRSEDAPYKLKLLQSYYEITIHLDNPEDLLFGQSGWVEIETGWRSKLGTLLTKAANLFWKQSGF